MAAKAITSTRLRSPSRLHLARRRRFGVPVALIGVLAIGAPLRADAQAAPEASQTPRTSSDLLPSLFTLPLKQGRLLGAPYLERLLRDVEMRAAARERNAAGNEYAERYGISADLAHNIMETSLAEGIDPELAFRLIRVESRFKARARGPRGALGLTQLMPATARYVDPSLRSESSILEPSNNLRVGFRYLRRMIEMFDGDVRLALLAYNRGEGTVRRALKRGRDPENGYSHKVLGSKSDGRYRGKGLVAVVTGG